MYETKIYYMIMLYYFKSKLISVYGKNPIFYK